MSACQVGPSEPCPLSWKGLSLVYVVDLWMENIMVIAAKSMHSRPAFDSKLDDDAGARLSSLGGHVLRGLHEISLRCYMALGRFCSYRNRELCCLAVCPWSVSLDGPGINDHLAVVELQSVIKRSVAWCLWPL